MKISSSQCPEDLDDHWSKVAEGMGQFHNAPTTKHYRDMEIELFKNYFGAIKGKKLLKLDLWNEVNNTKILIWAAQQGAEVHGLDISNFTVNAAKETFEKKGLKANLIQSDIRDIKFPDNTFDFLYTMGTIEHIPDYEIAVKEIYRVLKPGGKAIIGVPNKYDPFFWPVIVWGLTLFNKYPYAPETCFSMNELKKLVEDHGFRVIDKTGILFMPALIRVFDILFYKKLRFLCNLTKAMLLPFKLLGKRFKRHGYLIACVCEK